MKETMNGKAGKVKARMMKVRMMKAGQGDMAARSIDDERAAGQSWAFPDSRSRDARSAVSLTAILLPRDARAVIPRTTKSPESVKTQLPLLMTMKPSFEEVAGSLPPCSNVSVGPYTSCSISTESHESDKTLAASRCPVLSWHRPGGARHESDPTPNPLPREGDLSLAVIVYHHDHHSHPNKVTTVTVPHPGGH